MTISKLDILNKSLSTRLLGYSKAEVEQLLQEAAEALGAAAEARNGLKRRVRELEERLAEYRQREEALRDTLVTTHKMVEDIKTSARRESQLILEEAESKAEKIVRDAHSRVADIHEDIAGVKRQRLHFETEFRAILQAHLGLLDAKDPDLQKVEELESKIKYLKQAK